MMNPDLPTREPSDESEEADETIPTEFFEIAAADREIVFDEQDVGQKAREAINEYFLTVQVNPAIMEPYVYEGFDPNIVMRILLSKAKHENILKRDIEHMVAIFLLRGNNINKMRESMSPMGRSLLETLVARYNIKPGVKGQNKRTTITLSRVALCAPVSAISIMTACHATSLAPSHTCLSHIHCMFRCPALTPYLTEELGDHAYLLHLASNVLLGSLIGSKTDTLGSVKKFMAAAHNSPKACFAKVMDHLRSCCVHVPPTNWEVVESQLSTVLSDRNDNVVLSELKPKVEKALMLVSTPPKWAAYTRTPQTIGERLSTISLTPKTSMSAQVVRTSASRISVVESTPIQSSQQVQKK
nr:TPA_asm: hypothetical protein [Trichobi phenuili virus]